ncbi:hypothetical protein [Streptomyces parvus]|uniref:hypothetical protein n=1 Tax=Streptomyces parvus TaxID=66428 RepID=UPI0035E2671C
MSSPAERLDAGRWLTREQLHELLCVSGRISAPASKVLMYVASKVPLGERVGESVPEIGKRMGMSSSATYRAVGVLLDDGWLEEAGLLAGVRVYRAGPAVYMGLGISKSADTSSGQADRPLATVRHLPVPSPMP